MTEQQIKDNAPSGATHYLDDEKGFDYVRMNIYKFIWYFFYFLIKFIYVYTIIMRYSNVIKHGKDIIKITSIIVMKLILNLYSH